MSIIEIHRWTKYICCDARFYTPPMQKVLWAIDEALHNPLKILKHDPTSTVAVISVEDQSFVVKRANTKSWFHALRRSVCRSRAKRNWENAHKLHQAGIRTFQPVAFIEDRYGPFKRRSFFVYPYVSGIVALDYFAKGAQPQAEWPDIIKRIKQLLERMHQQGICHRDLNLSNLILVDHHPWLIDLDAMRSGYRLGGKERHKQRELSRFLSNCQDAPGISPQVLSLFHTIL